MPETRQVQDWTRIAEYVDEIRIMAYDFTFSKAKYPGPIAPTHWIEDVLEYGVSKVEPEKLVLGMHLYSYEWWRIEGDEEVDLSLEKDTLKNIILEESDVRSYTYETVKTALEKYEGDITKYQSENFFSYTRTYEDTGKTEERVLVYIDPEGIREREELAKEYGLKGVAYWRLGGEGDLIF